MVDYIEKIQYAGQESQYIESECFRSEWVWKYLSLSSSAIYNPSDAIRFSLDDYLPKDDYDYEVLATIETNTGTAAGNANYLWVISGSGWTFRVRAVAVRTSTASSENAAGSVIIPIVSTDRVIGIHLESGATKTGNTWFRVYGYRRLGKNDWDSNKEVYEKIRLNNADVYFGGNTIPGKWIVNSKTILNSYVIPAKSGDVNGSVDADVSSFIPNDGNEYEVIFDGTITTSTTNGQYIVLRNWIWELNTYFQVAACNVRSGATKLNYFNFRIPVKPDKKVIRLVNTGSSTATTNLRIQAYRRIGYNG